MSWCASQSNGTVLMIEKSLSDLLRMYKRQHALKIDLIAGKALADPSRPCAALRHNALEG
jgi:hypothetical protein